MTKISTYNLDEKITALDKWIGSDVNQQNRTKNFTPKKLAEYFNEDQIINIGVPLQYKYYTLDPGEQRPRGTLSFETEVGQNVNFSSITTFLLSKYTEKQNIVSDFLNFLNGSKVLLFKSNDINSFGFYEVTSIEPYETDPNFFVVTVQYETGNGFMQEDNDYMLSLVSLPQGAVPTKTSDLINDGQDGVHPFISEEDINRTEWDAAYDGKINSAEVTGTSTKTLTLTKQDGSTIEASWTDDNTDAVTSVFGRTGDVTAQSGDYNTGQITEVTNKKYQTDNQALFNDATSSIQTQLDSKQPSLGYTPVPNTRTITINGTSYDLSANRSWTIDTNSAVWGNISGTLSNQTDLQSALNAKVPYSGATGNINLGEYGLTSGYYKFDLTPTGTPTSLGTMYWDSFYRTVSLIDGDGDTTLQIGQEERVLVHNNTGSTLTDGQVVYVTGSTGELPSVALASATIESTSAATIGVVTESIAHGADGFITTSGIVNGLNTSAFNEGDLLWLGTTAGTFSTTKPISPNHLVLIGYVIKKAGGNGSILVKIQNTQELDECSDVLFSGLANNDLLVYETASALWKNKSLATVLGYTPANDSNVVHKTGNESIAGIKTFSSSPLLTTVPTISTALKVLVKNPSTGEISEQLLTFSKTVYFNSTNPSTATIFSLDNPPLVNDNSLKLLDTAIYIGSDSSTWVSNGTTYSTYTPISTGAGTPFYLYGTTVDAGSNKTSQISRNADIWANGVRLGMGNGNLSSNTVLGGGGAFNANTTGTYNVAIGAYALGSNTTGSSNFGIGFASLGGNATGSYNVAIGRASGRFSTNDYNLFLGYGAGLQLTSGSNNTFLGSNSANGKTGGSGNISIGQASSLPTTTGSNELSIGNTIYGLDLGLSTSKIGVGIALPTERFEVAGNLKGVSFIKTGGTSLQFLKADGSVDSNTYATTSQLHNPVTIGTANGLSLSTQVLSLGLASTSTNGALSSTDWNTFNNKQNALTNPVTGTGTAGWLTYWSGVETIDALNTATYPSLSELSYVKGVTSSIQTQLNNKVQSVAASLPLGSTGGTSPVISITQATTSSDGYLSSTDWNTFNNKQSALSGTGFVKISGTTITYDNNTYALDSSVVKITGDQSISGTKIFSTGISTNTITSNSFIKTGGTSSQFLKADGSVDSTSYQPLLTNPITGTGSTNYLSKFTGSGTLGNSLIYDNGTNVGINTTSPAEKLSVAGAIAITGGITGHGANRTTLSQEGANGAYWQSYGANTSTAGVFALRQASSDFSVNRIPLFIDPSGNVGIGTTSPSQKLTIGDGTGTSNQYLRVNSSASDIYIGQSGSGLFGLAANSGQNIAGDNQNFPMAIGTLGGQPLILGTSNAERMRITSGGNVGIGTTSPNFKLEVNGSIQSGSGINQLGLNSGNLDFYNAAATNKFIKLSDDSNSINAIGFSKSGSVATTWFPSGNVGIGTTSPSEKLQVGGSSGGVSTPTAIRLDDTYRTGGDSFNNLKFYLYKSATETYGFGLGDLADVQYWAGTTSTGQHRFFTSQTERMRITSGGNVGIGTTSPSGKLTVNGGAIRIESATGISSYIHYISPGNDEWSAGMDGSYNFQIAYSNGLGTPKMTLLKGGNVGIGTTAPSTKLDVVGAITASGGFFNSDIRLKEIVDYKYSVADIKPITYLWKDGRDSQKHVGYSAQEVQKVMPDAVNEGSDGMLSVNYVEVLVAKIAELENRIKLLENGLE